MKKVVSKILLACLVLCSMAFALFTGGCSGAKQANGEVVYTEQNKVVLVITTAEEGATLQDAMTAMQKEGKLTFVDDGSGMIVAVNGRGVSGNEFWGLYTSATDYANTAWGSVEYEGQTLGSAAFGYATLPALVGETYALVIAAW